MKKLFSILLVCFTLGLSAQGYIEITSCEVEDQITTQFSSLSSTITTEGSVLIDLDYWVYRIQLGKDVLTGSLGEEYSVPGPVKETTLYYWIIEEGIVLSALVHDNSFTSKWVSYVNVKGDIEHEFIFQNCQSQ